MVITDDDGRLVLKIIHPGGRTVCYDRPVPAKEIMDQHPKYCIAKPDVFQAPWFVVCPEATLMPGKQYLAVPKQTIKQLLKNHKTKRDTSSSGTPPHAVKESPSSALRRSATIHPDEQKVNHGSFSGKRSSGAKVSCVPVESQSMAKFKVYSKLFLSSFCMVNKMKEQHFPYVTRTQKTHSLPPPPQIPLPQQSPDCVSVKTKRKEELVELP